MNVMQFLSGKKTYVVVVAMFLFAGLGMYLGKLTGEQSVMLVLEGLAIAGLRSGIASNK